MGFRDRIRKGGGFLNNVDATITDYAFTNVSPGDERKQTKWVYFVPSFQQDGADDPVTQHMFLGATDRYEFSKDGKTLTMVEGGDVTISEKAPAGLFLATLIDKGFDESQIEEGEELNLEPIIGQRVRVVQEVDEAATKKLGKRKGKGGKGEYNRTNTVVAAVYEKTPEGGKSAKGKPNGKGVTTKPNGKGKPQQDDLTEEADAVLTDLLSENDGEVERGRLSLMLTRMLMKNPNREALKKLIISEDYLRREEGWSYDPASKKQTISAT